MQIKNYALIGSSAILGLSFALTTGMTSAADNARNRGEPKITMEQISSQMEEKYNGKVTEIELDREWGGDFYEMEIHSQDGYEYDVEVDANTGEIVEEERELENR